MQRFCYALGLRKKVKVIRAAGFRVRAAHVEAAKGMSPYHCAGAFSVEVKIAYMEALARAIQIFAIR